MAACAFTTISGPAFLYDPIGGAPVFATGTISYSCNALSTTNVVIALDAGLHSGGSANPWRKMLDSANNQTLNYNLYVDVLHTLIWGDGTNATQTQSSAQVPGTIAYTVYAQIPGNQNVSAGTFYDTITATMTF